LQFRFSKTVLRDLGDIFRGIHQPIGTRATLPEGQAHQLLPAYRFQTFPYPAPVDVNLLKSWCEIPDLRSEL
jgi:hypothetical protein